MVTNEQTFSDFLNSCTAAEALRTISQLLDRHPLTLSDPTTSEEIQNLALKFLELLPTDAKQLKKDLDTLFDLLTMRKICASQAPALSEEYEEFLQQKEMIQKYQTQLARTVSRDAFEMLSQRSKRQENTIAQYQKKSYLPYTIPEGTFLVALNACGENMPGVMEVIKTDRANLSMEAVRQLIIYNGTVCDLKNIIGDNVGSLSTVILGQEIKQLVYDVPVSLGEISLYFENKNCQINIPANLLTSAQIFAPGGGSVEQFASAHKLQYKVL